MKNIYLLLILFTTSCADSASNEDVKKQILDITTQYNKAWETLNVEKISANHSDESFLYWGRGEVACTSNEHFRKAFRNILPLMKKWTVKETSHLSVQVLNKEAAVVSFILKAESIAQDGTIGNHGSGAFTYVWGKINGQWKLTHIHESAKL